MVKKETFLLNIEAGAEAFGDGTHPSTKGAMVALEALSHLQGISRALDMGCGSGVLALQTAYQWHIPVVAADKEKTAVLATLTNAKANQLAELITAVRSDGYSHPTIREHAPYDLITSNILADILVRFSSDLAEHLAEEGVAVVSGILVWQASAVMEAFQEVGLTLLQRITIEDWVTLLWQKQDNT